MFCLGSQQCRALAFLVHRRLVSVLIKMDAPEVGNRAKGLMWSCFDGFDFLLGLLKPRADLFIYKADKGPGDKVSAQSDIT